MRRSKAVVPGAVALLVLAGAEGFAQVVISTQAGLINFTQDAVLLNDRQIEPKQGQFRQMREKDVLTTRTGLAEVLLTPGVFLRMGERSSVRLVSSDITNVRADVLAGVVIVEAAEIAKGSSVRLSAAQAEVSILRRGLYRLEADSSVLRVLDGKALVRAGGRSIEAGKGKTVALDDTLASAKFDRKRADWLDLWNRDRTAYLARLNLSTARSLGLQDGYGSSSGWAWNPVLGLFTFMPASGYYCNWYGSCFYSPRQVYYIYNNPQPPTGYGASGAAGRGVSASSGPSYSPGSWSGSSSGGATGSSSREAPPAASAPAPSPSGGRVAP